MKIMDPEANQGTLASQEAPSGRRALQAGPWGQKSQRDRASEWPLCESRGTIRVKGPLERLWVLSWIKAPGESRDGRDKGPKASQDPVRGGGRGQEIQVALSGTAALGRPRVSRQAKGHPTFFKNKFNPTRMSALTEPRLALGKACCAGPDSYHSSGKFHGCSAEFYPPGGGGGIFLPPLLFFPDS